jgi:hypothetical protein
MPKGHRIKPEQIVMLLRQIDVLESLSINGSSITTMSDRIALWVTDHLRLKVRFLILSIIKQPCFSDKISTLSLSVALN